MRTNSVSLFTKEEHAIIAGWLNVEPKCDHPNIPSSLEALEALGFDGKSTAYSEDEAAVASIVLERIQETLPQWSCVRYNECDEAVVTLAREIKERKTIRTVELVPQFLLKINWADTGPGFSWPVAYHATWVPLYDEYVVTQSSDCPDGFGYCDFAIGHFSATTKFAKKAAEEICADWYWQCNQLSQSAWAYVLEAGLINKRTAVEMRDEVWPEDVI